MSLAHNPFVRDIPRLVRPVDAQFSNALDADKAIVRLIGPRRVGKTDMVSAFARTHGVPLLSVTLKAIPTDVTHPGDIVLSLLDKELENLEHMPTAMHRKLQAAYVAIARKDSRTTSRSLGSELGAAFAGLSAKLTALRRDDQSPPPVRHTDPDIEVAYRLRALELAAGKLRIRPIVLFDEIQELALARPEVPTVWAIRNEIQHHTACRYVFAGSNQRLFSRLDSGPRAPLLLLGSSLSVPPLSSEEVDEWAVPLFRRGGRRVDSLFAATSLMAGKIGEVTEVCAALWDASRSGDTLHDNLQRDALLAAVLKHNAGLPPIRGLSARQTHVLRYVALNPGVNPMTRMNTATVDMNPGTIKRSLDALMTAGLIECFSDNHYTLATPLLTLAALHPVALREPLRRISVGIATEAMGRTRQGTRPKL